MARPRKAANRRGNDGPPFWGTGIALLAIAGIGFLLVGDFDDAAAPTRALTASSGTAAIAGNCDATGGAATRVKRVVDGDTVIVETRGQPDTTVRLDQIDAPERGQPWGRKSSQLLSELALTKDICLVTNGVDRYGRTIATIYVDDVDINRAMVSRGGAWAYRKYLRDRSLIDLEETAAAQGIGLWAMPAAQRIPPWIDRQSRMAPNNSPAAQPFVALPDVSGSTCDVEVSCKMLGSCQAARKRQDQCGGKGIDGDGDGIPCETLCRGGGI